MSFGLRILFSLVIMIATVALPGYLLKRLYPEPWSRWISKAWRLGVAASVLGVAVFFGGRALEAKEISLMGLTLATTLIMSTILLFFASPLWAGGPALLRWWQKRGEAPPSPGRRTFLMSALGTVPAATALASPVGTALALKAPVLTEVEIPIKDLPEALEGLKILQLTDVHLGTHIDIDQVESILETARDSAPDLIVLTGDVSDDYTKLPGALQAIKAFGAPLGALACIGNHEIYRGRSDAERIYKEEGVPLLCDGGIVLERGGARLYVGGSDDPARLGQDHRSFLKDAVARAMAPCPEDIQTRILLCHRPEGFEPAADLKVSLTLSGHTHGGQVALGGRSVFEPFAPDSYLLGHYQKGESHLYTSAGLGHWLPFRLNCPCEGALIRLVRA